MAGKASHPRFCCVTFVGSPRCSPRQFSSLPGVGAPEPRVDPQGLRIPQGLVEVGSSGCSLSLTDLGCLGHHRSSSTVPSAPTPCELKQLTSSPAGGEYLVLEMSRSCWCLTHLMPLLVSSLSRGKPEVNLKALSRILRAWISV